MKAKHARQIRIGIMAKCDPQLTCPNHDDCGSTLIDFERYFAYAIAYSKWADRPGGLAVRAYRRTKPWVSIRKSRELINA